MIIHNLEQRSQEWLNMKLGKITGTRLKGVCGSNNLPLLDELIAERMVGIAEFNYVNEAMQRGIDLEPIAMKAYEDATFNTVLEIGYIESEEFENVGLSPDGLIKYNSKLYTGAVEIKCPSSKKHIEYIRTNRVPAEYKHQVLMYFINVPTLEWLDFVSYDDRVIQKPLHIVRVTREELDSDIQDAKDQLTKFIDKLNKYYTQIIS
jgi:putative phage-type endonuclease